MRSTIVQTMMMTCVLGACASAPPKPAPVPPPVVTAPEPPPAPAPPPEPEKPAIPDAGPRPTAAVLFETAPQPGVVVDVERLPKANLPGKALAQFCKADKQATKVAGGTCMAHELPVKAAGLKGAGIVYWRNGQIPNPTQRMTLALQRDAGWKTVQLLGTGEVAMGATRTDDRVLVLATGAHDFPEMGSWVWADVMQRRYSTSGGRFDVRTLYLCGGPTDACKAIEVSRVVYVVDASGQPTSKVASAFNTTVTIHDDGQVHIAPTTPMPSEHPSMIGSHKLDKLPAAQGQASSNQ